MALTTSLVLGLTLASVAIAANGPITHFVSAGGPDACRSVFGVHPGCDGNYSLVATEYADGSVSGQYTDRLGRFGGFTAVLDCLSVDGRDAWVSGIITSGFFRDPDTNERFDFAGIAISAKLHDGTPVGEPDATGFSLLDELAFPCTDQPDVAQFEVTEGQVIVR
jgi:hypothetical protein